MLCQDCGQKPATLHFQKIVNGEKTEFHLCEGCAREKGEFIPGTANGFSIHSLISGLLDFDPKGQTAFGSMNKSPQCEECGMTYAQFSKMGRFGCNSCYKYFSERLDPLLRRIHGNTTHVGKVPERAGRHVRKKREIEQLKKELSVLIDREEFEKAALVRDQIRKLERQQTAE